MSEKNTFQQMRLIDRIDPAELSRGAAGLLGLIQRRAKDGWFQATGEYLAVCLKASRRSVVRWLAELREAGFIDVWRRAGVRNGVPQAAPSRYRVVVQAVVDAAARQLQERAALLKARMAAAFQRRAKAASDWRAICAKMAQDRNQDLRKDAWEGAQIPELTEDDVRADGRRIIGHRKHGLVTVPVWG